MWILAFVITALLFLGLMTSCALVVGQALLESHYANDGDEAALPPSRSPETV
jgi:hypothetical protein